MIEVKLDRSEMLTAALVAVTRHIENRQKGNNHRWGMNGPMEGWQRDIEGALGECAVAKALDFYWSSGRPRQADVGQWEVRSTAHHDGGLIVHDDDKDDAKYILVTGAEGNYKLRGWMYGHEAKQYPTKVLVKGMHEPHYVPQSDLRPMSTIWEGNI